ncbi:MAG: hypothetical protein ABI645_15985 [Pseudomonadota bacterium]
MSTSSLIIGGGHFALGVTYSALGLLTLWEVASQYRQRGLSRFGLGFLLMAASCGPHHLVHGWCVMHGGAVSLPMLAATLIGLPAGLVFVCLRIEAIAGGRGDRTIIAKPNTPIALAGVFAAAVGAFAAQAVAAPPLPGAAMCTMFGLKVQSQLLPGVNVLSLLFVSNVVAAAAYSIVGWYILSTQVRRYVTQRQWSLSGLSLAAVFPTCAFMHVIHALSAGSHSATLPFDMLGVPASIYFLWTVTRVQRDTLADWNRRPLVGVAGTPERSSPWGSARPR